MSKYLGRGATSRGRATINNDLSMSVSTVPYLQDPNDVAAVVQGISNLQKALSTVKGLTWYDPSPGQTAAAYVAAVSYMPPSIKSIKFTYAYKSSNL